MNEVDIFCPNVVQFAPCLCTLSNILCERSNKLFHLAEEVCLSTSRKPHQSMLYETLPLYPSYAMQAESRMAHIGSRDTHTGGVARGRNKLICGTWRDIALHWTPSSHILLTDVGQGGGGGHVLCTSAGE